MYHLADLLHFGPPFQPFYFLSSTNILNFLVVQIYHELFFFILGNALPLSEIVGHCAGVPLAKRFCPCGRTDIESLTRFFLWLWLLSTQNVCFIISLIASLLCFHDFHLLFILYGSSKGNTFFEVKFIPFALNISMYQLNSGTDFLKIFIDLRLFYLPVCFILFVCLFKFLVCFPPKQVTTSIFNT